jgi:hypothetical protein
LAYPSAPIRESPSSVHMHLDRKCPPDPYLQALTLPFCMRLFYIVCVEVTGKGKSMKEKRLELEAEMVAWRKLSNAIDQGDPC